MRASLLIVAALVSTTIGFAQAPPGNPGGGPTGEVQLRSRRLFLPAARHRFGFRRGGSYARRSGSFLAGRLVCRSGASGRTRFSRRHAKPKRWIWRSSQGDSTQKVSVQIPKNLDYRLAPGEIDAVRDRMTTLNLADAGVFHCRRSAMTSRSRESSSSSRRVWAWRRWLSSERRRRCRRSRSSRMSTASTWPSVVAPRPCSRRFKARGRRIGAYADLGKWMQEGVAPLDGVALLKDRLLVLKLGDRNALGKMARLS